MHCLLKTLECTASKPYGLSFSHGILSFNTESGYTTSNLLQEVDRRMYACKKKQKERADLASSSSEGECKYPIDWPGL